MSLSVLSSRPSSDPSHSNLLAQVKSLFEASNKLDDFAKSCEVPSVFLLHKEDKSQDSAGQLPQLFHESTGAASESPPQDQQVLAALAVNLDSGQPANLKVAAMATSQSGRGLCAWLLDRLAQHATTAILTDIPSTEWELDSHQITRWIHAEDGTATLGEIKLEVPESTNHELTAALAQLSSQEGPLDPSTVDLLSMSQEQAIEIVKSYIKAGKITQMTVSREAGLSSNAMVSLWLNHKLENRPDVDKKIAGWFVKQAPISLMPPEASAKHSTTHSSASKLIGALRAALAEEQMTQTELASELGTWPASISVWLKGKATNSKLTADIELWLKHRTSPEARRARFAEQASAFNNRRESTADATDKAKAGSKPRGGAGHNKVLLKALVQYGARDLSGTPPLEVLLHVAGFLEALRPSLESLHPKASELDALGACARLVLPLLSDDTELNPQESLRVGLRGSWTVSELAALSFGQLLILGGRGLYATLVPKPNYWSDFQALLDKFVRILGDPTQDPTWGPNVYAAGTALVALCQGPEESTKVGHLAGRAVELLRHWSKSRLPEASTAVCMLELLLAMSQDFESSSDEDSEGTEDEGSTDRVRALIKEMRQHGVEELLAELETSMVAAVDNLSASIQAKYDTVLDLSRQLAERVREGSELEDKHSEEEDVCVELEGESLEEWCGQAKEAVGAMLSQIKSVQPKSEARLDSPDVLAALYAQPILPQLGDKLDGCCSQLCEQLEAVISVCKTAAVSEETSDAVLELGFLQVHKGMKHFWQSVQEQQESNQDKQLYFVSSIAQGLEITQQLNKLVNSCSTAKQQQCDDLQIVQRESEHATGVYNAVLHSEAAQQDKRSSSQTIAEADERLAALRTKEAELEEQLRLVREQIDTEEAKRTQANLLPTVLQHREDSLKSESERLAGMLQVSSQTSGLVSRVLEYVQQASSAVEDHYLSLTHQCLSTKLAWAHSVLSSEGKALAGSRKRTREEPSEGVTEEARREGVVLLEQLKMLRNSCADTVLHKIQPQIDELVALCIQLRGAALSGELYSGEQATAALFASEYTSNHLVPHWHVEQPSRTETVETRIREQAELPGNQIQLHDAVICPQTAGWLSLVHQPAYLHFLHKRSMEVEASGKPYEELHLNSSDHDTFTSLQSHQAALASASVVCRGVDLVMRGKSPSAFCCVRPPGHHAGRSGGALRECSQGFCLVNNVCTGIAYARVEYRLARVCIIDIDVHHGNGTEDIVQGDPETLFLSVHRYGDDFFPKLCGQTTRPDQMDGNVLNVGLPEGFAGEQFREVITRFGARIDQFKPELVFISAGFDGHTRDPIGGAGLTEEDFFWATKQLQAAADRSCNGRLVSVLEGGYHIAALGNSAVAHVCALAGRELPETPEYETHAATGHSDRNLLIEQVVQAMKKGGYTQSQVSKEAGLSSNGIVSLWINKKMPLRPDLDAKMAAWLKTQPGGLNLAEEASSKGRVKAAPLECSAPYQQHLRETLDALMKAGGYSQSAVARDLDTWPSYISMFIGKNKPYPKTGIEKLVQWMRAKGAKILEPSHVVMEPGPSIVTKEENPEMMIIEASDEPITLD